MATKFTRVNLTLVCKTGDERKISNELVQALDVIDGDVAIYGDSITTAPARRPSDFDPDEEDD